MIAGSGYSREFISATEQYIRTLRRAREDPELQELGLRGFVREPLEPGWIHYCEPYKAVHRHNLELVLSTA